MTNGLTEKEALKFLGIKSKDTFYAWRKKVPPGDEMALGRDGNGRAVNRYSMRWLKRVRKARSKAT